MHVLADFLNHGTLPFIGREAELRRIVEFWRGTFEATELHAMLLTGEAGIGKSRLLEQAMRRVVESGGSVVHVKLYPESTASFASLIARALHHPDAGRGILAEEPEPKLAAIGEAMRRLARLRPTLFVLEDLHLLGSETVPEFARLLNLLADETIALLALARPVELDARGTLEPYLIEDLVLSGLGLEDCARIWEAVSGAAGTPEVAATLHDATLGNPLALRSALRGALKPANVVGSGKAGSVGAAAHARALARTLKRSVGLLADGMTAHLSPEELNGARRLASLGEVFAREAADIMIDDADAVIESLLFKGIISTVTAPPDSLPGESSLRPPLGFTHTLLHRQLIDDSHVDADRLVRVLAYGPLYSILPFQSLSARRWGALLLDDTAIIRAFDRTIKVQMMLDQSAMWKSSEHIWNTAVGLVMSRLGGWKREQWERMLVKLIYHRLSLVRREPVEVQRYWLDYLLAVTTGDASDELATGRLYALSNRILRYSTGRPDLMLENWQEAERLITARSHLQCTFAYTDYVIAACIAAHNNHDTEMKRRIENRTGEILASPDLPAPVRATFVRKVRPPLLSLYEDEEELRLRLSHVSEFERTVEWGDMPIWIFCIDLLAETGAAHMLERICDNTIPLIREQGMLDLLAYTQVRQQRLRAGLGEPLPALAEKFEKILAEVPEPRRLQIAPTLALLLVDAALLCDEMEEARAFINHYGGDLQPAQRILLALDAPDPIAVLKAGSLEEGYGNLAPLINMLVGEAGPEDIASIENLIRAPLLRLADIIRICCVADVVGSVRARDIPIPANLVDAVAGALIRSLEWLADPERALFVFMRSVLRHGTGCFNDRQATAWRKKIEELALSHGRKSEVRENGRMRLSMLGTIMMENSNGDRQRFQGPRARMLLGMMVINSILKDPLSSAEFCRLAAGDDAAEIENARDIVKTTVHRLRDIIGKDAILTNGQTPRLNPDLVEVDLQEAYLLLRRASEAMRRSSPMQAKAALMAALAITRGEVPFPSLYDDFIEAVREDFENDMRTTALEVARTLAREGGMEDAVEVLRSAVEAMRGDEELAEELRDMLLRAGRYAEAERTRMKVEAV